MQQQLAAARRWARRPGIQAFRPQHDQRQAPRPSVLRLYVGLTGEAEPAAAPCKAGDPIADALRQVRYNLRSGIVMVVTSVACSATASFSGIVPHHADRPLAYALHPAGFGFVPSWGGRGRMRACRFPKGEATLQQKKRRPLGRHATFSKRSS